MTVDLDSFFHENLVPFQHAILEAEDYITALDNEGALPGLATGLGSLDAHMRFLPRELVVIAGRSGTGKTALGLQLCENVGRQLIANDDDGLVAIFSAEMDSRTLALRIACGLEGIPLWRLQNGETTRAERNKLRDRLQTMKRLPFVIDQSPAPTLEHMQEQLSVYAEDRPIRLILLDYAELAGEWAQQEGLRIAKIMRGMAALAKRFDATSLVLSQLNRSIEGRMEKKPRLSDLMHGGEREPDRIVVLVADDDDPECIMCYGIKNRNAPLFEAALIFDGPTMRFKSAIVETVDLEPHYADDK